MPATWLCGSPAVSLSLLLAVFEAAPRAAAVADPRGIFPLHWICANAHASAEMVRRTVGSVPPLTVPSQAVGGPRRREALGCGAPLTSARRREGLSRGAGGPFWAHLRF